MTVILMVTPEEREYWRLHDREKGLRDKYSFSGDVG